MQMSFVNCDLVPMLEAVRTNSRNYAVNASGGEARKLTFVLNLKWIFNHLQVPQKKEAHRLVCYNHSDTRMHVGGFGLLIEMFDWCQMKHQNRACCD